MRTWVMVVRGGGGAGWAPRAAALLVVAAMVAAVAWPLGAAGLAVWRSAGAAGAVGGAAPVVPWWEAAAAGFGAPAGIAALATVLGWPMAWVLRGGGRGRRWMTVLAGAPLLLPMHMAYSGWMLVRRPGWALGDALEEAPAWVSVAFNRGVAFAALALWLAPLCAWVMAAGLRSVPEGTLAALRMEPAGPVSRWLALARLARGPIVAAWGVGALVMLGSAVPLHLAQVNTHAIRLWSLLALRPVGEVWLAAWPLVGVALAGAWWVSRLVLVERDGSAPEAAGHGGGALGGGVRWAMVGAGVVWAAGVVAPLALLALSLRDSASLGAFWREEGDAVAASAGVAAATGGIAGGLAILTWLACSATGGRGGVRRVVEGVLVGFVAMALLPGVLVGSAWSQAAGAAPWIEDGGIVVVLAHVSRFGFVGVLAGVWLARLEPAETRDARALDGATGAWGWWRAAAAGQASAVVGVVVAVAALSLHEIEASVQVQPPGLPSLAQRMLELLHYNAEERTAAAAVNLMLGTAAAAVLAAAAWWRVRR